MCMCATKKQTISNHFKPFHSMRPALLLQSVRRDARSAASLVSATARPPATQRESAAPPSYIVCVLGFSSWAAAPLAVRQTVDSRSAKAMQASTWTRRRDRWPREWDVGSGDVGGVACLLLLCATVRTTQMLTGTSSTRVPILDSDCGLHCPCPFLGVDLTGANTHECKSRNANR